MEMEYSLSFATMTTEELKNCLCCDFPDFGHLYMLAWHHQLSYFVGHLMVELHSNWLLIWPKAPNQPQNVQFQAVSRLI